MRDLVLIVGFLGLLPLCFIRPYVGVLVWTWFAIMNPHRETFGFAYDLHYNLLIAAATMSGWLMSIETKKFPVNTTTVLFFFFAGWTVITTFTAYQEAYSWIYFNKIPSKVYIFIFALLLIVNTKSRIIAMVWVLCISIGYYSTRNGLVALITGGANLGKATDFGPPATMIGERNHLALAMVMILPLLVYLIRYIERKWIRNMLIAVVVLSVLAVLASYSRGGLVALIAMVGMIWLRSNKKVIVMVLVVSLAVPAFLVMPDEWRARMTFSQEKVGGDASFLGRVEAWCMATKIANARPFVGGGFSATQHPQVAARFGPQCDYIDDGLPVYQRAAHSIYFQVLGDHGWMGLFLLLGVLGSTLWRSQTVRRACKGREDLLWAKDLVTATQISLAGFLVGGAALSMAYFDGYFILLVIIVALDRVVKAEVNPGLAEKKRFKPKAFDSMQPVPAE